VYETGSFNDAVKDNFDVRMLSSLEKVGQRLVGHLRQ